ncbi:MAG: anthranilate synthase component I, partial [Firmicutes bacterium]|nr:anthranilate synthase component I [Bacillota bacterium]
MRAGHVLVPVWTSWTADLDTPISLYKKLAPRTPSFLLESVEGGAYLARYSFLGCDPFLVFRYRSGRAELWADGARRTVSGTPLGLLRAVLEGYRAPRPEGLPRFWGGAVGYLAYDAVRYLERVPVRAEDDLGLPEAVFLFPRAVLVFDHLYQRVLAVANLPVTGEAGRDYRRAVAYLEALAVA